MCAHQIRHFEVFHLIGSPIQLLVSRRKEVQAADDRVYWLVGKFLSGKGEDVDDSSVSAARVHDQARWGLHFSADIPVAFWVFSRHRTCQPRTWKDFRRRFMFDEPSPGRFVLLLQCDHPVIFTLGRWSAVENAACDMNY